MTGTVVNLRYGLVIITGSDSRQYYYSPERDTEDLGAEAFRIGAAVSFVADGVVARRLVVTGQTFEPESGGFA